MSRDKRPRLDRAYKATVIEIHGKGTCDVCRRAECGQVLVEFQGGPRDGQRVWVCGADLPPHKGTGA